VQKLKTTSGKRTIDMRAAAYEALRGQQKYKTADCEAIFLDPRYGKPWESDNVLRKRFVKILRKAGVRYRNPYQARHTFASTLLSTGVNPLYVSMQMGHETVEMIQKKYGRWIEQGDDPATKQKLDDFFSTDFMLRDDVCDQ
jgi:integrase